MLVHAPELFDDAIAACTNIAEDHATNRKEKRQTVEKHLAHVVPDLAKLLEYDKIIDALWSFTESLAELIREKKNTIWSFIIRNSYRPAMLKGQFDIIVGNPPWLSYRFISDPEYQLEVKKRAVDMYQIAPKSQKLFTQMELATVFLVHSMATFANASAQLAFVMPRAVLSADQHQNLILRKYSTTAKLRLTGYWDLWEVAPLFNVPCAVLFAKRDFLPGSPKDVLPVLEWGGKLPGRDMHWENAKQHLDWQEREGRVIYLGSRAALSTGPGVSFPTKPSKYQSAFRQGATIVPRSVFFVRISDMRGAPQSDVMYWAETDPEQALLAKKPYDDVHLNGLVEGKFVYSTAVARHVLPFCVLTPATIVLLLENREGVLTMLTAEDLNREGFREFAKWMSQAEAIWNMKREEKADKQDIYERLDYQKELTRQDLSQKHLVLYNADGMNVSASLFDRGSYAFPFVLDRTVYWAAFSNPAEANYVCSFLNSQTVNLAIKPFQSTGLLGERHVHKKLLELPIPVFDSEDQRHRSLAALGLAANEEARKALLSSEFPGNSSTARQRSFMRGVVESELKEIDKLVAALLDR